MPSIQDISKQVRRGGSRNPLGAGDELCLHGRVRVEAQWERRGNICDHLATVPSVGHVTVSNQLAVV